MAAAVLRRHLVIYDASPPLYCTRSFVRFFQNVKVHFARHKDGQIYSEFVGRWGRCFSLENKSVTYGVLEAKDF